MLPFPATEDDMNTIPRNERSFATFAIKLIKGNHNMVELKIRPYK